MAPSKLKRALGHVKDQTSISLAKVGGSTSISDLEVAIVKATRHEEYPAEERYIREIISLTSYSRAYISACVNTLSRRLNKTQNWTVALKTLILIQRLLAEGDPAYEQEIFFSTRRGTRILNMSDFRDTSRSNSWDYSAFHLQQLLDRFLACRPTGTAKCNRVVTVALYPIVKESFQIYYDITEILGILIDRFMQLDVSESVKVYEIFSREAKQFDELDNFYSWCKSVGICRSSEYPEIEKITQKKLELIDEFIRDKSALQQCKMIEDQEELIQEVNEPEAEPEIDMNAIKALPAPEEPSLLGEEEPEEVKEEDNSKALVVQQEADLLNLGEYAMSSQDHANQLALALFDGGAPAAAGPSAPGPNWEAFKDEADWESALVQSASNITNQRATLGGGFDMLMLDGMYQQGQTVAAMAQSGFAATGSASSVAFGSAGRPAMLALPAPPSSNGMGGNGGDPFAASLQVAPPPYVQMSDMEKKQRLLMEEQAMWEQYKRDGRQGHIATSAMQQTYPNPNNYNQGRQGGYMHGYNY
ncbi:ENTH/ANTH/VHS superfamily protein [Corchorus capsularis]|uniref:ENTH/ANTH/VHS superfamily protein n=1 Tax=Corchorus capsularis TaxID=210143 RepID=A0A1R3KGB7_COCAP|nr:ENTH/ANTH/VHS superfamily protein [Corchorus capsularis]